MNTNVLYWGDNLPLLRNKDYFPDESVDLVYLDPPFNSNASYNVLFKESTGAPSTAQLQAFADTWHWDDAAEKTWADLQGPPTPKRVVDTLDAFQKIIVLQEGRFARNAMMAYLVMMTARLLELHRVLKPTGSLYLHCDPTASHYLKIILDTIFGATNFRNEIVWQRTTPKGHAFTRFPSNHDVILSFGKDGRSTWHSLHVPHKESYVASHYYNIEPETGRRYSLDSCINPNHDRPNLTYDWNGQTKVWRWTKERMQRMHDEGRLVYTKTGTPRYKRYLDEMEGTPIHDVWTDIFPVNSQAKDRLGYPTQKPLALLERIIQASSNEGDVVLDPFCGCGTAVLAAHKLNRRWIGIDVTNLAITVMKARLTDAFPGIQFKVIGEPTTLSEARTLAAKGATLEERYQFQWWAVSLVGALPSEKSKKGADAGIDGFFSVIHESDGKRETFRQVIVQVKSGHVGANLIRDLAGTIGNDKLGVFITLEEPTEPMKAAASAAGLYHNPLMDKHYPRIQIVTVAELLAGKTLNLPPRPGREGGPRITRVQQGQMEIG